MSGICYSQDSRWIPSNNWLVGVAGVWYVPKAHLKKLTPMLATYNVLKYLQIASHSTHSFATQNGHMATSLCILDMVKQQLINSNYIWSSQVTYHIILVNRCPYYYWSSQVTHLLGKLVTLKYSNYNNNKYYYSYIKII